MRFWENKVALVTGGSSGIGRAFARLVTERGGKAVLADIDVEAGTRGVEFLGGSEKAAFVKTDVTSEDEVRNAVEFALATFGSIDMLHNNASIRNRYDQIEDIPLELFRRVLEVNVIGMFLSARAVVAYERQGAGVDAGHVL